MSEVPPAEHCEFSFLCQFSSVKAFPFTVKQEQGHPLRSRMGRYWSFEERRSSGRRLNGSRECRMTVGSIRDVY